MSDNEVEKKVPASTAMITDLIAHQELKKPFGERRRVFLLVKQHCARTLTESL